MKKNENMIKLIITKHSAAGILLITVGTLEFIIQAISEYTGFSLKNHVIVAIGIISYILAFLLRNTYLHTRKK